MLLQMTLFHSFLWLSSIPLDTYMCVCVCGCMYVYIKPHLLYLFICQWTFRLLPCLGYCKQCCYEYWGACIFSNQSLHLFWVYAQEWDCWIIWQLYLQFFKAPPYSSPQWLHQFTFPPKVQKNSCFSTSSLIFVICGLFDDSYSDKCEVIPHCDFDLHFSDDQ